MPYLFRHPESQLSILFRSEFTSSHEQGFIPEDEAFEHVDDYGNHVRGKHGGSHEFEELGLSPDALEVATREREGEQRDEELAEGSPKGQLLRRTFEIMAEASLRVP